MQYAIAGEAHYDPEQEAYIQQHLAECKECRMTVEINNRPPDE